MRDSCSTNNSHLPDIGVATNLAKRLRKQHAQRKQSHFFCAMSLLKSFAAMATKAASEWLSIRFAMLWSALETSNAVAGVVRDRLVLGASAEHGCGPRVCGRGSQLQSAEAARRRCLCGCLFHCVMTALYVRVAGAGAGAEE